MLTHVPLPAARAPRLVASPWRKHSIQTNVFARKGGNPIAP